MRCDKRSLCGMGRGNSFVLPFLRSLKTSKCCFNPKRAVAMRVCEPGSLDRCDPATDIYSMKYVPKQARFWKILPFLED